jgi:hypothetical protein
MKVQKIARLRHIGMLGIALTASVLLAGGSKAASTPAPPYKYEVEDDVLTMSNGCQKFQGGVVVPVSTVLPHKYILLLVFDSESHATTAGTALFNVGATEFLTSFGCMVDPAMTRAGVPIPSQGLKVKGGCPTDCLTPGMQVRALNSTPRALNASPDPLSDIQPAQGAGGKTTKMHWGIFFGDPEHQDKSNIRVWQIRVANASHAQQILKAMDADLSNQSKVPGYMGNLLIGYRPVVGP